MSEVTCGLIVWLLSSEQQWYVYQAFLCVVFVLHSNKAYGYHIVKSFCWVIIILEETFRVFAFTFSLDKVIEHICTCHISQFFMCHQTWAKWQWIFLHHPNSLKNYRQLHNCCAVRHTWSFCKFKLHSVFIFVLTSMPVIICENLHCTKISHYTVALRAKLGALLIWFVVILLVQAVNTRLLNLNITYGLFNQHEILELSETAKQFREKQILISVIGRLNVGKSTLMNAILGAKLVIIQ